MTGVIATIPRIQFSNALGLPLAGGKLHTYLAGTTSPEPTYQDEELTIANSNPVTLDATGSCVLWLDPEKKYKFLLKSALGVTQPGWPVDDISGAVSGAGQIGFIQAGPGAVKTTAQEKLREISITPEDFGAIGDGRIETAAMARFFAAWHSGGRFALGRNKTYIIDQQISIPAYMGFEFDMRGSVIKAADGMPAGSTTRLLHLTGCTDFEIRNGQFDGNRAKRAPSESTSHLFQLTGCKRFKLERVRADNATCDGFYLNGVSNLDSSTFCSDFVIENCHANNGYRQGMTIVNAYNGTIIGGSYINSNGTAPQAGIDIEANAGSVVPSNRNIKLIGVNFAGCKGYGLQVSSEGSPDDISAIGCFFSDCTLGGVIASGSVSIISSRFYNFTAAGAVGVKCGARPETFVRVVDSEFENFVAPAAQCIDDGTVTGRVYVSGNRFKSVVTAMDGSGMIVECLNNDVDGSSSIALSFAGTGKVRASGNGVRNSTGRAILCTAPGAEITHNRCKDVVNVNGAYIQCESAGSRIHYNECESTTPAATTIGIRAGSAVESVMHNRCVNLHSTDPYSFIGGRDNVLFGFNSGGAANHPRAMRSPVGVPSYTTSARPAAAAVAAGTGAVMIWNTSTGVPNFSDGTAWRDATGALA